MSATGQLKNATSALLATLLISLAGCAGLKERHGLRQDLVQRAGWQSRVVETRQFAIAVSAPNRTGRVLTVYLEGDGRAYLNATMASADPTPSDPIALRMALSDPAQTPVAYIARPCQYTLPAHGRNCDRRYWTSERYAPAIVDSIGEVLDREKSRVGASRLILVGYSGGGALAALLAQRRTDVSALVTVAANLDLQYWTTRDHLTPLDGSLDPAQQAWRINGLPQIHLAGAEDRVTGADVTQAFLQRMGQGAERRTQTIPGFSHDCCWAQQWSALLQLPAVSEVLSVRTASADGN